MPLNEQEKKPAPAKGNKIWIISTIVLALILILVIAARWIDTNWLMIILIAGTVVWLAYEYIRKNVKQDKWKIAKNVAQNAYQQEAVILDTSGGNCRVDRIGEDEYAVHFFKEALTYKYGKHGVFAEDVSTLRLTKQDIERNEVSKTMALEARKEALYRKRLEDLGLAEE